MFTFTSDYFKIDRDQISGFQTLICYLGASSFTTLLNNPLTVYRQIIQQSSSDPIVANSTAKKLFTKSPLYVGLSGLSPRLFGLIVKKLPIYGTLSSLLYFRNEQEKVSFFTSIYFGIIGSIIINPLRFIEKQQRSLFLLNGKKVSIRDIYIQCKFQNFIPLYRGLLPHCAHSLLSSIFGIYLQPVLQKYFANNFQNQYRFQSNFLSSCCVSPIYVIVSNPFIRIETIMQTSCVKSPKTSFVKAIEYLNNDYKQFGIKALFRGQGIGIVKAIFTLSIFHEVRMMISNFCKERNNLLLNYRNYE
jgi:hypothetical protein